MVRVCGVAQVSRIALRLFAILGACAFFGGCEAEPSRKRPPRTEVTNEDFFNALDTADSMELFSLHGGDFDLQ